MTKALTVAGKEQLTYQGFLAELLLAECDDRDRLGTAAAEKGYRVKYTSATRLVNELVEAAEEKFLAKTIARYGRVDLLCIDELGYIELDRRGEKLHCDRLQRILSGWTKTFTDPRLCAAIVDRLTFSGTITETGTDTHRLAATLAQMAVH